MIETVPDTSSSMTSSSVTSPLLPSHLVTIHPQLKSSLTMNKDAATLVSLMSIESNISASSYTAFILLNYTITPSSRFDDNTEDSSHLFYKTVNIKERDLVSDAHSKLQDI